MTIHPTTAAFNQLSALTTEQMIDTIADFFPKGIALTSSFGVQSAIMIDLAHKTGLHVPVITIDIAGPDYAAQRAYRTALQRHYDLDLRVIPAASEAEKRAALDSHLKVLNIAATIDGIRRTQTGTRATKDFAEARGHIIAFHPLLNWPHARADYYIENLPQAVRHPQWQPGARSKGGRILQQDEAKTECSLHI